MKKPSKTAKNDKSKNQEPEKPVLTWDEQTKQFDLNSISEMYQVKFAILNAETPKFISHIENLQSYLYVNSNFTIKPIIFEEVQYIVKHYPAWNRPYVPPELEKCFQQACEEAKLYTRKLKPIPLKLMANLVKLRAIILVYEHVYYELNPGENPVFNAVSIEDLLSCSSVTEISIETEEDEKCNDDGASVQDDTTSLNNEIEFDKDTMNMVYNYSSPLLQDYIAAIQMQWNRRESINYEDDFKTKNVRPWVSRHCQSTIDKNANLTKQKMKKSTSTMVTTSKIMYIVLFGFYDVLLVKELHEIGIDFLCLIAFGEENETTIFLPKPERLESPSCDSLNNFVDPIYYFSTATENNKKENYGVTCKNYAYIKESVILMFWIKIEELCESSQNFNNIIWFRYATPAQSFEEKIVYSDAYWKAGAKLFRTISQYLHSLIYLEKYHRLYLRSLIVTELGDKPERIYVNKMFYYNNSLRSIPQDCIKVGHILEGLLDEVCNRIAIESTETNKENIGDEFFGEEDFIQEYFGEEYFGEEYTKKIIETPISKHNKKTEKFLLRLFKKFKFSYMPVDPISFVNSHSNLLSIDNNMELTRKRFEIYASNKLELETKYYPKLQNTLKLTTIEHLKQSFPALLWKIYDEDEDFQDRSVSSLIFQTWLSYIRLSQQQCSERLSIKFCESVQCQEKSKYYSFCGLHEYFVKPIWLSTVGSVKEEGIDTCKVKVNTSQIYRTPSDGSQAEDFHWQEKLTPEVLLQQTSEDFTYYDCCDHLYSPFLDKIIVRFHDPTDDFGSSVYIWEESIRSPIGLYNFYKHIIFEDSRWLKELEDTLANLEAFPPQSIYNSSQANSLNMLEEEIKTPLDNFEDVPYILTTIQTFEEFFIQSPFITSNNILTAFNLDDRAGAGGTTTIFHSTEGLKITVDVQRVFGTRNINLKVQGDRHVFILHANPKNQFLFHFESPNGIRIVFAKPKNEEIKPKSYEIIKRKENKKVFAEKESFLKETNYINFKKRSEFGEKRKLTDDSFENIFFNVCNENINESTSRNSLRDVESVDDIALKSTFSLTTISKRSIPPPIGFEKVFNDLRKIKRNTIPHFKIISTALHKRKYVSVLRNKITLNFLNRSIPIKFIPKIDVSNKIEISKCSGINLPFDTVTLNDEINKEIEIGEESIQNDLNEETNDIKPNGKEPEKQEDIIEKYDVRITLPSGLQISTIPDPDDSNKLLVVQKYLIKGAMNDSIEDEVSRTFTRQGFIRIKYQNGSMKMFGLNGKTISGEIVSIKPENVKRKPSKIYFENLYYHKCIKLHKNIHKKINRFQKRFINKPGLRYLRLTLSKRDKFFKSLLNDFKNTPYLFDYVKLTPRQLLTPIIFKIHKDSFQDHYKFNFTTKDSFTSINSDGQQVTSFLDGTIISSWYQIAQEMIVIETDDLDGVLEIDDDDYSCNFLVPKIGGWIDVSLCIQFQHRQYATVVYRLDGEEVSIYLPDNIEVKIKSDGTYFLNLNDTMYGQISSEKIKIRSNFCKKCYDCCETNLYVKHLYNNNEDIPPYDILLEAKDNFNKYFKVEYCGMCYRNKNYQDGDTTTCQSHRKDTMEKFYSFDRNFSGTAYWTNSMFMDRILCARGKYKKENVKYYLDENQSIRAYEIISYFVQHYCDRFLMQYRRSDPPALLMPKSKPQCFGPIAYIKRRFVEILPDLTAIIPLLNAINQWNVQRPWELHLPTDEMIDGPILPKISTTSSESSLNLKLTPRFIETAVEQFKDLNVLAKDFRINRYSNGDSFSEIIDDNQPVCKCDQDKSQDISFDSDIETQLNTFYERFPEKSFTKRKDTTPWSSMDAMSKMLVVPVNSKISNISKPKKHKEILVLNDDLNNDSSSLDFIKQTEKGSKRKSLPPIQVIPFEKNFNSKSTSILFPLLQPGIFEWRKADLNESSCSEISDTKDTKEMNQKLAKKKQYNKNKSTETQQPFDVLGLNATKNISGTILVAKTGSQDKTRQEKTSQVKMNGSKQEVIEKQEGSITNQKSEKSVLKMTSMDKIYKKVSDLKCCPDMEKRSYTECRKPKLIQSEETSTSKSRIFKELPLILPIKKINDYD
ncbi:uncharacterized protein [Onthophagus taurus]|uniref:uncharacterized protein n=1 Tax=Onthophagus taurus TaxID=166361 RepID=UPI0039BDF439